jgi:hypothetical protein
MSSTPSCLEGGHEDFVNVMHSPWYMPHAHNARVLLVRMQAQGWQ